MFPWKTPEDAFLFSPTEPAAAPAASATPTDSTPAASQTTATPPAASGEPAPTTTAPVASSAEPVSAQSGSTQTPAASAPVSWLDSFRKEGFQATDEATAQKQLLQAYRDAETLRPLAPAVSAYQQHAQQFHQWLGEQQKAQRTQKDWTESLGWTPPAGDFEQLRRQVTTDAQGNVVPVQGAPPDAAIKYQAANAYRQEFATKFLDNPGKALEPYIRHIAEQVASQSSQQGVGQYREQQEANQFIDKHSSWLFEQGADGAPKTDQVFNPQTGRYDSQRVLGQYGKMFVQSLQTYAQHGISSEMQQQLALKDVQNAYMASPEYVQWLVSQQTPATPAPAAPAVQAGTARQQANAAFTQRANPAAPPAPRGSGNATPAPQKVNRENLEQVMLQRFQEAGVSTS